MSLSNVCNIWISASFKHFPTSAAKTIEGIIIQIFNSITCWIVERLIYFICRLVGWRFVDWLLVHWLVIHWLMVNGFMADRLMVNCLMADRLVVDGLVMTGLVVRAFMADGFMACRTPGFITCRTRGFMVRCFMVDTDRFVVDGLVGSWHIRVKIEEIVYCIMSKFRIIHRFYMSNFILLKLFKLRLKCFNLRLKEGDVLKKGYL